MVLAISAVLREMLLLLLLMMLLVLVTGVTYVKVILAAFNLPCPLLRPQLRAI